MTHLGKSTRSATRRVMCHTVGNIFALEGMERKEASHLSCDALPVLVVVGVQLIVYRFVFVGGVRCDRRYNCTSGCMPCAACSNPSVPSQPYPRDTFNSILVAGAGYAWTSFFSFFFSSRPCGVFAIGFHTVTVMDAMSSSAYTA